MMWLLYLVMAAVPLSAALADVCEPLVACPERLQADSVANPLVAEQACQLKDGSTGILCRSGTGLDYRFGRVARSIISPDQTSETTEDVETLLRPLTRRLREPETYTIRLPSTRRQYTAYSAPRTPQRTLTSKDRVDTQSSGVTTVVPGSPEELQLAFGRLQSPEAEIEFQKSLQDVKVLTVLKKQNAVGVRPFSAVVPFSRRPTDRRASLPRFPDTGPGRIPGCKIPPDPDCTGAEKFRRNNGECNNKLKPRMGKAVTAFTRFFPAEYDDNVWEPRKSQSNSELPSARLVSGRVIDTSRRGDQLHTLVVMLFGQFINHDMISTPISGGLLCCSGGGLTFPDFPLHPTACNPIRVPADDPFYSQFGRTCMNHVRSKTAPFEGCLSGPASQLNQVSQFLDLSNIYGSSDGQNQELRSGVGGQIKTSEGNLLPKRGGRFFSGEGRLNENPGLTFMHTIWTREHNRVADELARLNPQWDDERLYQEARRITNGEYQHIIYHEYVPTVLGFQYTQRHRGLRRRSGLSFSYDSNSDPRISAEFSTAAFRFGHSQVQDQWLLQSESRQILQRLNMEDTFFRSDLLEQPHAMLHLANSLLRQKGRSVDHTFSPSVHEKLFAQGRPQGLDLVSLNIQRGRDHGLPTYVTVLENCLEREIQGDWDGLAEFFEPAVLARLRSVYESVFDIDLYIGGIAEKRKPGALVGQVFQCLIGEQFVSIRFGDRFFYNNGGQPNSFTNPQLQQLQEASLARIFCDNIEGLKKVQPLVMRQPRGFNVNRKCSSLGIPRIDLSIFGDDTQFQG